MKTSVFLKEPIKDLPVSEVFYLRSKLMGFGSIEEILATPPDVMLKKEAFNYKWLGELVQLLTRYNMLYRLQSQPGSNFY